MFVTDIMILAMSVYNNEGNTLKNSVMCSTWLSVLCACLLQLFSASVHAATSITHADADKVPLVFGLLPSESPVAKFKRYAPLRDYLQIMLQRQVLLETAKNFPEFLRRTRAGKYDFLETAPHFVLPVIDNGQYVVLTTITQPLSVQLVVKKTSPVQQIQELQGKLIATPSPRAIITRIGKEMLDSSGLHGNQQAQFRAYKTHNAAYEAVLGDQADAALISINIYNKAMQQKKAIRSIASSFSFPNMSIIAANSMPLRLRSRLQGALAGMLKRDEGRRVLSAMSYPGYRVAIAQEFYVLRKYSSMEQE